MINLTEYMKHTNPAVAKRFAQRLRADSSQTREFNKRIMVGSDRHWSGETNADANDVEVSSSNSSDTAQSQLSHSSGQLAH